MKSLTSGTSTTDSLGVDVKRSSKENRLSGREICSIIAACSKNGVLSLEYSGLHIKFQSLGQEIATSVSQPVDHVEMVSNENPDEISINEDATDEAEQGMLMVEDPIEYERLQISRHIERLRKNAEAHA